MRRKNNKGWGIHVDDNNVVTGVDPNSPAAGKIEPDDRIVAVNGTNVSSREETIKFIDEPKGAKITITIKSTIIRLLNYKYRLINVYL